jgi:hypothetical protein
LDAPPFPYAGNSESGEAKGCIKGALVSGTAGHFAGHHGLLEAAADCVIGRPKPTNVQRCSTIRLAEERIAFHATNENYCALLSEMIFIISRRDNITTS